MTRKQWENINHCISMYIEQVSDGYSADYCESTLAILYTLLSLVYDGSYVGNVCSDLRELRQVMLGNKEYLKTTCEHPAVIYQYTKEYC